MSELGAYLTDTLSTPREQSEPLTDNTHPTRSVNHTEPTSPPIGFTAVVSDFHLTDAEEADPRHPLWKRYKHRDLFIDDSFERFLHYIQEAATGPVELILNGDIFDFDPVTLLPEEPEFAISLLERLRGLRPEQPKSVFKMKCILRDHPVFVRALHDFLLAGNRVIIVIGNHDLELHWPTVQQELRDALEIPDEAQERLTFCEWFYLSGSDTLVQHGNQFDAYCMCSDPIHPTVGFRSPSRIRLPFGDIANRLMLNGMGMFNPYVEESFLGGLRAHLSFFYRYVIRVQPLLLFTWLWSAMATLALSLREGFLPSKKQPEVLAARVEDIAKRSNTTASVVIALRATGVHPAIFNPWKVARELWLDRALLLFLGAFVSFQIFSILNVFVRLSAWWIALPFAIFLLPFVFYAHSVQSEVRETEINIHKRLPTAARIAGVSRVVLGHTHRERHTGIRGVELLNTGTWSSAYHDVECTKPYGHKCFAWIYPDPAGAERIAQLRVWNDPGSEVFRPDAPPGGLRLKRIEARRRRREDALKPPSTV